MNRLSRLLLLALSFLVGCTALSCDDGLTPDQWDARERARAAAGLPDARAALEGEFARALKANTPAGPVLAELSTPRREFFHLGGVYTLGGPLHRHGLFGGPSMYLVSREQLWVTDQGARLLFSQSATSGSPFSKVVHLPFEDIAAVGISTLARSSFISFTSRRENVIYALLFPLGDSTNVGKAAALVPQRAPAAKFTRIPR